MTGGERYCLLVDRNSGLPIYFPSLYVTTQKRNRSLSYSNMESTLGAISVFIKYLEHRKIDINHRLIIGEVLDTHEIEALSDYCQKNYIATITKNISILSPSKINGHLDNVGNHCHYIRLTVIADYLGWLFRTLSSGHAASASNVKVCKMLNEILARRPVKKSLNTLDVKGLNEQQIEVLFEIFRPGSDLNPFQDNSVSIRNRLMFLMLYHLGLRGGELLNIRIRDINFSNNQLKVTRRSDQKDDPRRDQPRCKTRDRVLPLKDSLANEIHKYILNIRKHFVRNGQADYLFVTHKSGPHKGQAISKSAYKKILNIIKSVSPSLFNFTGHSLRHTWNQKFSELIDSMEVPPTEEYQENMRSYLMGWAPGSGTANVYNKRYVKEKAAAISLKLQADIIRTPNRPLND